MPVYRAFPPTIQPRSTTAHADQTPLGDRVDGFTQLGIIKHTFHMRFPHAPTVANLRLHFNAKLCVVVAAAPVGPAMQLRNRLPARVRERALHLRAAYAVDAAADF